MALLRLEFRQLVARQRLRLIRHLWQALYAGICRQAGMSEYGKTMITGAQTVPKMSITRAKGRVIKNGIPAPEPEIVIHWVPQDKIDAVWPLIEPFLQEALEYGNGRWASRDFQGFCRDDVMQLWLILDNGAVTAMAITELINYPQKKICRIVVCGGRNVGRWLNERRHIDEWARQNGCQAMELIGREGWARMMPDWRRMVFLEKDLD